MVEDDSALDEEEDDYEDEELDETDEDYEDEEGSEEAGADTREL